MNAKEGARKLNILAVDDQPANLIALEAVFSGDYNVIGANSGAEAISILEGRNDIAVILMDIQMPDMDGFEVTARIKQLDHCKDIPVIFITAIYKEDPFVKRGYDLGAVDYFGKPFDPEILKKKVAIYAALREKSDLLKEREKHIRESEEVLKAGRKLSTLLETLPVGVLISDVEGRICQTNDEVSRIYKATGPIERDSYGEILGWWDTNGHMLKGHNGPLARALHFGETHHNQIIPIQCLDGSKKTILGSASPLLGLDGKIVGAVVIMKDVTESKKVGEDFEQRITKLISLGVELEQTASH